METIETIKNKIDLLNDQIRQAPEGTPHREIFKLYLEIERLEDELSAIKSRPGGQEKEQ